MVGRIIEGKYEILEKIGQGGMAAVYRARQLSLDRVVAIKMLSGILIAIGDFRDRFEQEAKIIARLSHPNIVQVYDTCEIEGDEGGLCIIMEYVAGRTLDRVLREQRPLPIERAMAIAEQVASGLAYAHNQGVVHRDIKPQNIMLVGDDWVKIMDFGIARLRGSTIRTQTGATLGTPEYMSPEQAEGKPLDHRSDIYSLGVVLYGMVTGELPFAGDSPVAIGLKHIREKPRRPTEINAGIPAAVEAIILKTMAKQPSERYASAEELRQTLIDATPTAGTGLVAGSQPTLATAPPSSPEVGLPPSPRLARELAGFVDVLRAKLAAVKTIVQRSPRWTMAAAGGLLVAIIILILVLPSAKGNPRRGAASSTTPGSVSSAEQTTQGALFAREIEVLMRRLNDEPTSDSNRAKRALETAREAASRLAGAHGAPGERALVTKCLNEFIAGIIHDREDWRCQEQFAQFLIENSDQWSLPPPVRDGLLGDARELLRRAKQFCPDSAGRAKMNDLEQQIERLLKQR